MSRAVCTLVNPLVSLWWYMSANPELEAEQAYIDRAYEALERTRAAARAVRTDIETGPGGTFQARYERDVMSKAFYEITGIKESLAKVGSGKVHITVKAGDKSFEALLRVDTPQEVLYYEHGGILPYVLRQLIK